MWPFGKRLRDQDAVQKYRDWLRKWLLGSGRVVAAATVAAVVLAGIIWAIVNTWTNNAISAIGEKPGTEAVQEMNTNSSSGESNILTDRPEDKQVKQSELETNSKNNDLGRNESSQEQVASSEISAAETAAAEPPAAEIPSLSLPVSGKKISSYGYHYSTLYDDYRFHTGIRLQTDDSRGVRPCMQGTVTGILAAEGNGYTVLVDHGGGWASKYEGLASVAVEKNSSLSTSDSLGMAKTNVDNQGEITFTLTRNGEAVDPALYFDEPA